MAKKKKKKISEEKKSIILAVLILGFVFGFDDGKEIFNLQAWTSNFITQIIISAIFLLIFISVTKKLTKKLGIETEFSIWNVKRFGFAKAAVLKKASIPLGVLLPLFLTIASYGKMFFSAVLTPNFKYKKEKRLEKKFENPSEAEISLACLIGPLTLAIIAIFLTSIRTIPINNLSLIPFSIAFSTMLPLPRLNGIHVYFGTPINYVFSMAFIIAVFFLTKITTPIESIIIGVVSSIIFTASYYLVRFIPKAYS
tara:strand:- start:126 stop:887 length:762 start_codon:yes stop_codon:yes gene_type:complete